MDRLTQEKQIGPFAALVDKAETVPGAFGTYDCLNAHMVAVTRLKQYEDTELLPEEVERLKEYSRSILTQDKSKFLGIISDVIAERKRQDEKWGEQNHKNFVWVSIIGEEYGELCKAVNEYSFEPTPDTKRDIYTEAIQTMASCMAMLECIERNTANKGAEE